MTGNKRALSRSGFLLLRITAVIALLPFITLSIFGRLQTTIRLEWFPQVDTPLTLAGLLFIALIGAYASRKIKYMNLNAIHGIIGVIVSGMLIFKLILSILPAILVCVVLCPIVYMVITGTPPNTLTCKPKEGESEITVLSFILGKHKKANKT